MARFWPISAVYRHFYFRLAATLKKLQSENNASEISSPQRVISLAPSITENTVCTGCGR